jgi:hypothetical protein
MTRWRFRVRSLRGALSSAACRGCATTTLFTHYGMFGIPPYLREVISKARVLTDEQPFLWEA